MKIKELFKNHTAAFALIASVAAVALPAAALATSDEGGAGMSSGASSSDTGYTVQQSTPAGAVPADVGGAGSTTGSASESGYTINQSTPAGVVPAEVPAADAGGSGITTGSGAAAGQTLASEVKGTIDSIDAARRQVTIRDTQGNLASYKLKAGANVQVQGHKAALSALTKGDAVTVTPAANDPTAATAITVGS